jgi:MFS family permease
MKSKRFTHNPGIYRLSSLLDGSLERFAIGQSGKGLVRRLRWFWLDGLLATISINFYSSFVPLFAAAYGATNTRIGQLSAVASLSGMIALLPGARIARQLGGRRRLAVLASATLARIALLAWVALPAALPSPGAAIAWIMAINAVIAFANNFAAPVWIDMVADIVPKRIRGSYMGYRNQAANLSALLIVPLAGWLIQVAGRPGTPFAGYQIVFALAFVSGAFATFAFAKIDDPAASADSAGEPQLRLRELTPALRSAPGFLGLVTSTLIWNLGVQLTAPFLMVYLVTDLGASTTMVGWVVAATNLSALVTQRWLGRLVDRRGSIAIQGALSLVIPLIPLAWMVAPSPWHVLVIHIIAGVLWTGYGLASFNVLLDLAPERARSEATALFQLVVAGSAAVSPAVGGYLADAYGFRPMFIGSFVLRALGALAFLWLVARPAVRLARQAALAEELEDSRDG